MGLWDKIAFITRSKANALMDSLEDPQEAINQTIADALVEYAKVKAAAAKVIAGETSAKNTLAEYEKKHTQYEKAAENLCQSCRSWYRSIRLADMNISRQSNSKRKRAVFAALF